MDKLTTFRRRWECYLRWSGDFTLSYEKRKKYLDKFRNMSDGMRILKIESGVYENG